VVNGILLNPRGGPHSVKQCAGPDVNWVNIVMGMLTIMLNSIISVITSPHEFLSAALKCYNTFNLQIGPGLSTLLGQETVWWGDTKILITWKTNETNIY
jgi:hypothetical protein